MLTLRRSAWIRWLPPIDSASPSPVIDPDRQVGPGRRQAGRDRRGAAVDRVHAVAVDVVRQPGRAADPGDDHDVLPRHLQRRQERLERGEDRVVTAAGAPADFLVGLEVLGRQAASRAGRACSDAEPMAVVALGHVRHVRSLPQSRSRARPPGTAGPGPGCRRSTSHQVLAAQQQGELAQVDLRHQHLVVAPQHLAEVGRERVEVAQVGLGDLVPRLARAADRRPDRAVGRRPSRARGPCASPSGSSTSRSGTAMPSIFAWRARTIRSWLSGS